MSCANEDAANARAKNGRLTLTRLRLRRPSDSSPGGWVAAIMDELLGFAQGLAGQHGVTATLKIRYRHVTPIDEDLRGQRHEHTWDHRVAATSGPGKHICMICGKIRL